MGLCFVSNGEVDSFLSGLGRRSCSNFLASAVRLHLCFGPDAQVRSML